MYLALYSVPSMLFQHRKEASTGRPWKHLRYVRGHMSETERQVPLVMLGFPKPTES